MLTKPQTTKATAIAAVTPKTTLSRPDRAGGSASTGTSRAGCGTTSSTGDDSASATRLRFWVGLSVPEWSRVPAPRTRAQPPSPSDGGRSTLSRVPRYAIRGQERELRSVRPRTMPMNACTRSSSLSTRQASPTFVGRQVGDRPVGRRPCGGGGGPRTSARSARRCRRRRPRPRPSPTSAGSPAGARSGSSPTACGSTSCSSARSARVTSSTTVTTCSLRDDDDRRPRRTTGCSAGRRGRSAAAPGTCRASRRAARPPARAGRPGPGRAGRARRSRQVRAHLSGVAPVTNPTRNASAMQTT